MNKRILVLIGFFSAFAAAPVAAEVVNLAATLSAANEVPPASSSGTGTASVTYDTTSRLATWDVQVQGLSAPTSAAHFHGPGGPRENASVVIPVAKTGDASPFKGSATLTPEQAEALLAGRWYVNIHTPAHPPGEIRGQVVKK